MPAFESNKGCQRRHDFYAEPRNYLLFSTEHQMYNIMSIGLTSMRRRYEELTLFTYIRNEDGK